MYSSRNPFIGNVPIQQQQIMYQYPNTTNHQYFQGRPINQNPSQIKYQNVAHQHGVRINSAQQFNNNTAKKEDTQIASQLIIPIQPPQQFTVNQNKFSSTNSNCCKSSFLLKLFDDDYHVPKPKMPVYLNDDDEIILTQDTKVKNQYELEKNLKLEVKTQFKIRRLLQDNKQYLPGIVSVKTNENVSNTKMSRIGIDLICLIDISGSMSGDKIQMVKSTLIQLLQFLTEKDRLQLILFNDEASRLTPLKRVTDANKQYFKSEIFKIESEGGTCISSATNLGIQQIKQRKYKNKATSIFLLSDGQDQCVQIISQQLQQINEEFTINSFGFGEDHDAEMMTAICNLKSGSFYFVQNITLLDEFFADAIGGLISIVGQELQISIKCQPPQPFQDIKILKTYGPMWRQQNKQYMIQCPHIAFGSRKDFVFVLELPQMNTFLKDNERNPLIIEAQLKIKCPTSGQIIVKNAFLNLTFLNNNENVSQQQLIEDVDVAAQYYRVEGANIINYAKQACAQNQFEKAQESLNQLIAKIKRNPKVAEISDGILQDLEQAKQGSQRENYLNYGQKVMCQIVSNNYQQQGVNSVFSAQGVQMQPIQQAVYQNQTQFQMVQAVQAQKIQKRI